jgi:hypothetical protein
MSNIYDIMDIKLMRCFKQKKDLGRLSLIDTDQVQRHLDIENRRLDMVENITQSLSQASETDKMILVQALSAINIRPSSSQRDNQVADIVQSFSNVIPVNTHRRTDQRVQRYDAELKLVEVHEGLREAARAIRGINSSIRTAYLNNTLYRGFRWYLVDRDSNSSNARVIPETATPLKKSGRVAQISDDGEIIMVHQDQISAAENVGLSNSSSITIAMKKNSKARGFKWMPFSDCSKIAVDQWVANGSPQGTCRDAHRGHRVHILDPNTRENVRTFENMQEACHLLGTSHKMIHKSYNNDTVHLGFRWEIE